MKKMRVTGTFLCILLLLLQRSSGQEAFNDANTLHLPDSHNIGWMAALDDNKFISEITIPGTHDALALHGGPFAKCQAWSLMDQLKAGIRYFDLRVSGEGLKIKHGITYQHITFPEVQTTIEKFLSFYPTETVLVRVKPVFWFKDKVPHLIKEKINYSISWVNHEIPRIGMVRGKIVYVQKALFNLGVPCNGTDKKGDYKVSDVELKKEKILKHLHHARELVLLKKDFVVLSYSSGTGASLKGVFKFLTPKRVAEEINPFLYKYVEKASNENPKPSFGIIAMDYPGIDLIQKIINLN